MHIDAPTLLSRRFIVLLFSLAVFGGRFVPSQCQSKNGTDTSDLEREYSQNTFDLAKQWKEHVKTRLWQIYNHTQLVPVSANLSAQGGSCFDQLQLALESPVDTTAFEWLMQMYDSSGGTPSGLLSGTTISLGDYDQCLRVAAENNNQFSETQYCLLTLQARRIEKFTSIRFDDDQQSNALTTWEREHIDKWLITDNKVPVVIGLCLPSTCNAREKEQIVRSASSLVQRFDAKVDYCQSNSQDVTGKLWNLLPLILALAMLTFIVGLGTFLDFLANTQFGRNWSRQLNHFVVRLLRCFSLITNAKILFDVKDRHEKPPKSSKSAASNGAKSVSYQADGAVLGDTKRKLVHLDILDGIRVNSIAWIIVSHCTSFTQVPYLMKVSPLAHFPFAFLKSKDDNWLVSSYLLSTFYPVSIFFMVSGILVIYSYKKNNKCKVKQHFFRHFMMRVFRLSPTLLATMGLTYFLRYIGSGPLFHQQLVDPYVEPCRTHFWYHFFFLHNFLPIDQRCGSHTWYVGADFQLNMVAFVVVHLIRCRSKWFIGLLVTMAIIAISGIIPLALIVFGFGQIPNFDAFVDPRSRLPVTDLNLFYYASYIHAGSFFIGVILGYLLSSGWNFNFLTKNKLTRSVLFFISSGTMMQVPLAMRYFVFPDAASVGDRSPLFTAILFQFCLYSYNIAMATFIFICALNPSLYMSQFLSAKCFRPIARMVFSAYLSHQVFIWFSLQQLRFPLVVNVYTLFCFTSMIVTITSMSSMALYLLVECPFMRIGKLLFATKTANTSSKTTAGGGGHLMMQSISTVESYSRPVSRRDSIGEHLDSGTELQSIIVPQSHRSQFAEPEVDSGAESADQNNNSQFTSRATDAVTRNGHGHDQ